MADEREAEKNGTIKALVSLSDAHGGWFFRLAVVAGISYLVWLGHGLPQDMARLTSDQERIADRLTAEQNRLSDLVMTEQRRQADLFLAEQARSNEIWAELQRQLGVLQVLPVGLTEIRLRTDAQSERLKLLYDTTSDNLTLLREAILATAERLNRLERGIGRNEADTTRSRTNP